MGFSFFVVFFVCGAGSGFLRFFLSFRRFSFPSGACNRPFSGRGTVRQGDN